MVNTGLPLQAEEPLWKLMSTAAAEPINSTAARREVKRNDIIWSVCWRKLRALRFGMMVASSGSSWWVFEQKEKRESSRVDRKLVLGVGGLE